MLGARLDRNIPLKEGNRNIHTGFALLDGKFFFISDYSSSPEVIGRGLEY